MARSFKNRFQEFKFREFKNTKGILEKFGLSENSKGCAAAASGTDARRHIDDCRQRLEQSIRDDEVLRMRLDLLDVRINRDAECEKHKRPEKLKVDELIGEAEAAGGKVAEDLLVNEDITSGEGCSSRRQRRNSWTSFLRGASTVR